MTMSKTIHAAGRPVWAEISLKAILKNLGVIRRHVGPKPEILAVVKSNGYGLGAVPISRALEKAGVNWFGVTCANEGVELREAGVRKRILVLTGFWPGEEKRLVEYRLTPAVTNCDQLKLLERAAVRAGKKLRGRLEFHFKIDSGMNRLGASPESIPCFVRALADCKHLKLAGTFTHL